MSELYAFNFKDINGKDRSMSEFKNKTIIIVNTASDCGFTPQYKGLEDLYLKYKEKDLVVLGFPCNQFGGQEPGSETEIKSFCNLRFNITFPLMAKVEVNGEKTHPLFDYLKNKAPGLLGTKNIKWNFTKFLIDKNGNVLKRFAPQDEPDKMYDDIDKIL